MLIRAIEKTIRMAYMVTMLAGACITSLSSVRNAASRHHVCGNVSIPQTRQSTQDYEQGDPGMTCRKDLDES